jgi:hypothetical protein
MRSACLRISVYGNATHFSNRIAVLHIGHLAPNDLSKGQQLACWVHCGVTGPKLGSHDLLCCKVGSVQGGLVSAHVCRQPGIQLAVHGGEYTLKAYYSHC